MTWCLVASMSAPTKSSDLKEAPLSFAESTVSFSFWPTDRAASCWQRLLSSERQDRDNERLDTWRPEYQIFLRLLIIHVRIHFIINVQRVGQSIAIIPLKATIWATALLSWSPFMSLVWASPSGLTTSEILSVTRKRRFSSSKFVTLAITVWPGWKAFVVSLRNLSIMAWREAEKGKSLVRKRLRGEDFQVRRSQTKALYLPT